MAYLNGQLPATELAALAGNPGMVLRRDAAQAFNAMHAQAPVHVRDSYRILGAPGDLAAGRWSQWACWERYKYHGGPLAAVPGHSVHGWGLAIDVWDLAARATIDRVGAHFGFAKSWSDAQSEFWHICFKPGVWQPPPPPPPARSYHGTGDVYFELVGYVDFDQGATWHMQIRGIRAPTGPYPSFSHASGKAYFKLPGRFDLSAAQWGGGIHGRSAP